MNTRPPAFERPSNKKATESRADLWALVWGQPYIDAARLAQAIELDLTDLPCPDFRTRLLVRDAAKAMRSFWGVKLLRPVAGFNFRRGQGSAHPGREIGADRLPFYSETIGGEYRFGCSTADF